MDLQKPDNYEATKTALRAKAEEARALLRMGKISHEEAKRRVNAYFAYITPYAKAIAKEHGMAYKPLSAAAYLR